MYQLPQAQPNIPVLLLLEPLIDILMQRLARSLGVTVLTPAQFFEMAGV